MAYVIKCDRCSVLGEEGYRNDLPVGWKQVGLQVKISGSTCWNHHQFCPECVEYLGISLPIDEETYAEKLVAILESMVEEAVDEREA